MKIGIVIENDMYVRNFILSGALDPIFSKHETMTVLSDQPVMLRKAAEEHIGYFPKAKMGHYRRKQENINLVYGWNRISILFYQDRSSTFSSKVKYNWLPPEYSKTEIQLAKNFRDFNNDIQELRHSFEQGLFPNTTIDFSLYNFEPDVVLFPHTGVEATGYELIKAGYRTIFLQNGWDNISSKGILPMLPEHMGVWGPQSVHLAKSINEAKGYKFTALGCARYEPIKETSKKTLHYRQNILFAGSTAPFDEYAALAALQPHGKAQRADLVYRPHPWAEGFKSEISDLSFSDSIFMDKQYNPAWGARGISSMGYPGLVQFYSDLSKYKLVVTPLSSVMMEALLLGVPVVALAYNDGLNRIPMSEILKWEHFKGIEELGGLVVCHDVKTIGDCVPQALKKSKSAGIHANHFVTLPGGYGNRVLEMIGG